MLYSGMLKYNNHGVPTGMVTDTASKVEFLLLPVSIGEQKTTTIINSSTTHNYFDENIQDIESSYAGHYLALYS